MRWGADGVNRLATRRAFYDGQTDLLVFQRDPDAVRIKILARGPRFRVGQSAVDQPRLSAKAVFRRPTRAPDNPKSLRIIPLRMQQLETRSGASTGQIRGISL
jgi:hypothetical protein